MVRQAGQSNSVYLDDGFQPAGWSHLKPTFLRLLETLSQLASVRAESLALTRERACSAGSVDIWLEGRDVV